MIRQPKYKVARRVGERIFPKTQTPKFTASLARKGPVKKGRGRGKSEFSQQLLEKQKIKLTYGTSETQFAKYVRLAQKKHNSNPVSELNKFLESRLDNVIYRSGFAVSRTAARQLVSHGHFLVNGVRVNIPSLNVYAGDKILLRKQSQPKTPFLNIKNKLKAQVKWLKVDQENLEVEILAEPTINDADQTLNFATVVEFYSRA